MRSNRLALLALAGLALFGASRAEANCTWTLAPASFDFGNYSVFSSGSTSAVSSLAFSCNPNSTATLTISRGTQSASFSPRTMTSPAGDAIAYNLFRDAAGSAVWGDGSEGSFMTVTASPQQKDFTAEIFGRVYPEADAAVGTYNDYVAVTLEWDRPKAGSSSITLAIQVTVIPECQATGATLDFGTYQPIGSHATAPLDSQTALSVYCTRKAVATIAMASGNFAVGAQRRMRSDASDFLAYDLFSNSGMSVVWDGTNTVSATATSKFTPIGGGIPLYGRVPAGQDVSAGTYQDTVQAVVNY
jgi:spore coat protein U-like protein